MEKTINLKMSEETCTVCDMEKEKGLHLYNSFICLDCEREIVQTETDDDRYLYYLNKLRDIIKPEILS